MKLTKAILGVAFAVAGLIGTSVAHAGPTFQLQVSAGSYSQIFNGVVNGKSGSLNTGPLNINGGAGERYTVGNIGGAFSLTSHGWSFNLSALQINHLALVPGSITLALTFTDLTGDEVKSFAGTLASSLSQVLPAAAISGAIFISDGNTAFGLDTQLMSFATQSGQGTHSEDLDLVQNSGALYSLTLVLNIAQLTAGRVVDEAVLGINAVPEPSSMMLLLAGLLLTMLVGSSWSRAGARP